MICAFSTRGEVYHVAWIASDAAHLDGLRKGLCQNAVNIAHGLCVERFGLRDGDAVLFDDFAVLVPFGNDAAVGEQIAVKAMDDMRRELGELHRAESGFDVRCDLGLVGLDRAVFLREQIIALLPGSLPTVTRASHRPSGPAGCCQHPTRREYLLFLALLFPPISC